MDLVIEEMEDSEVEVVVMPEDLTGAEEDSIEAVMVAPVEVEEVILIGMAEVTSTEVEDSKNRLDQAVATVHKIRKLNLTTKL